MTKISVVMTTYNREATLPRAIDSILAQTFKDFEFIIVDDGSSGETPSILKNYAKQDKRIKIITQQNHGLAASRNNGVAAAKGEYIAFIDDDDACAVNRLEIQLKFLEENPKYKACIIYPINDIGGFQPGIRADECTSVIARSGSIFRSRDSIRVLGPNSLIDREAYLLAGGSRSNKNIIEDLDLTLRFQNIYPLAVLNSENNFFYTAPHKRKDTSLMNEDFLLFAKRYVATCISEWCRYKGMEDPAKDENGLEDILSILPQLPFSDRERIYRTMTYLEELLVSTGDMDYDEAKDYLASLVSNDPQDGLAIKRDNESDYPKISVVMATYNQAASLPRAIDSILAQTFRDFEFIIVNDGSTDDTDVILKNYAKQHKRIKLITQKNQGQATAFNNGVAEAKGKYIAFMDSDDACAVNRLEIQLKFLEENSKYKACSLPLTDIGKFHPGVRVDEDTSYEERSGNIFSGKDYPYIDSTSIMDREAFLSVGGHRTSKNIIADIDFTFRFQSIFSWAALKSYGSYFYTFPHKRTDASQANQNIPLSAKRKVATYISEWCRFQGLVDPVNVENDLADILALAQRIPMKDRALIYHYMEWFEVSLVAEEIMSQVEARNYILNLAGIPSLTKISVVLVTYNQADTLPRAVDSILAQSFTGFEFIIVDDGSNDDTAAILKDYAKQDSRIKIITQQRQGLAAARNNGVTAAAGEYIAFIDGDACCAVNRLEMQLKFLESHSQYRACSIVGAADMAEFHPGIKGDGYSSFSELRGSVCRNNNHSFHLLDATSLISTVAFLLIDGNRTDKSVVAELDFTLRFQEKFAWAALNSQQAYFPALANEQADAALDVDDFLLLARRHLATHISGWCRYKGMADPVTDESRLEDILSITRQMPVRYKARIYRCLRHLEEVLVAEHDKSPGQARNFLLGLLGSNFWQRLKIKRSYEKQFARGSISGPIHI